MKGPKPLVLGAALVLGLAGLAWALPAGVFGLLDLTAERLQPPPEIRLVSPQDGDGTGSAVQISGQATSIGGAILDVQYRIDGGRWESAQLATRGRPVSAFAVDLPLDPGTHVLEVRASDGESVSLPARVLVRRDAPTVRIAQPADGDGIPAGPLLVSGTVAGRGVESVVLEVAGARVETVPGPGGLWQASVDVPAGLHEIRATAFAPIPSLPRAIRVAAAAPAPPSVIVSTPRDHAAYGEAGDLACGGGCILFSGTALGSAKRIAVDVDGWPAGDAALAAGAWSFRLPMVSLASGPHEISFRPFGDLGQAGVAKTIRIVARTSHGLEILGAEGPQPTGTILAFEVKGDHTANATWTLDGEPAAVGPQARIALARPGDHVLAVQTIAPTGRASSTSLPLHALNRAPTVAFLGEPRLLGSAWQFNVQAVDVDGAVVEYRWSFGDGRAESTKDPSVLHRYDRRGTYKVSLEAIDDLGALTRVETTLQVPNAAPLASFEWAPLEPRVGELVRLNDTSVDPDGTIVERFWRFPDGNFTHEPAPTVRFHERGPHPITLVVTDELGFVSEITSSIEVANTPPLAAFRHEPAFPLTHEEVLFADASADVDGVLVAWSWDFGDNTTGDGRATSHVYRAPGSYAVRLRIEDDAGARVDLVQNLTISDSPPEVAGVRVEPPRPVAQEEARLVLLASDRDGDVAEVRWDFGDGTTSFDFEPVHRYARSGTYHANVTVFDAAGLNATYGFPVHVLNAPPYAALRVEGLSIAAFPTRLVADGSGDQDGRLVLFRTDADGDGYPDCTSREPLCAYVYEKPGLYAARVQVEDDEGGLAEAEILVNVGLPPSHLAPPRVGVESPRRGADIRGEYLFRGSALGPRDVLEVEIQLRAGGFAYGAGRDPWRSASGTTDWHSLFDTRHFPDGAYEIVVRATDTAGAVGIARVPVVIENGPRPSDVTLVVLEPPTTVDEDVEVRGSAYHPEGVTTVRWRIGEGDWRQVTQNPLAFTLRIERELLAPGDHVLQVEAYHGVSERANHSHAFTVPGVRPLLVVDEPPGPIAHALLHAEGRIVGVGRAQWRLDQGLWNDLPPGPAWKLSEDTLDIRGGNHTLQFRAVSPDGRLASEVASYRIFIRNPPFEEPVDVEGRPTTLRPVPVGWGGLFAALSIAMVLRRKSA